MQKKKKKRKRCPPSLRLSFFHFHRLILSPTVSSTVGRTALYACPIATEHEEKGRNMNEGGQGRGRIDVSSFLPSIFRTSFFFDHIRPPL
mmetsp:Transcript_46379/g.91506  ORF Transcript_46379/g.91506 Transcript_46379/m.91506 type:complete len:90 (-) Transcript_46379:354-623(-)